MIFNEIQFLRELHICENIVSLEQVFCELDENRFIKSISLVMKFAKYGSILKHLQGFQRFGEDEIRSIMGQLLLAVDLMHRKNIIHRDIKPDNILVLDRHNLQICISDLGFSCWTFDFEEIALRCGTPGYVAPEILFGF